MDDKEDKNEEKIKNQNLFIIIIAGSILSASISFYYTYKISNKYSALLSKIDELEQTMVFYEEEFMELKENFVLRSGLSKISIPSFPEEDKRLDGKTGGLQDYYCANGEQPEISRFMAGEYYHIWEYNDGVTSKAMLTIEKARAKGKFHIGNKNVYINQIDMNSMKFQSHKLKIYNEDKDGNILEFGSPEVIFSKKNCPKELNLY